MPKSGTAQYHKLVDRTQPEVVSISVCSNSTKLVRKLMMLEGVLQFFRDQDDTFIYQIDAVDRFHNGIVMEALLNDLTKHLENDLWKIQVPFIFDIGYHTTANSLGTIESVWYMENYQNLLRLILQIQSAVEGKSEAK